MIQNDFEKQLESHHNEAYLWAVQCCNYNQDDAKDVLQNVYMKILEGRAKYKGQSAMKTWLFSVIRNTAIDQKRKLIIHDDIANTEIAAAEPVSDSDYYRSMIETLPLRQQEVLLLHFYHEMTLENIAMVLELHVGTVRTHYSRGKEALRLLIKKEEV
jgi:RNA polymerase sigma factor (sigma-70 family)